MKLLMNERLQDDQFQRKTSQASLLLRGVGKIFHFRQEWEKFNGEHSQINFIVLDGTARVKNYTLFEP